MRLFCRFAIVLYLIVPGLSLPTTGVAAGQEDRASPINSSVQGQPPAPKENAPADQAPAETTGRATANPKTPAAVEKTSEGATTKKTDAASAHGTSAHGTKKRHKRTPPAPDGVPRKIVVREGGASEPAAQIAADITPAEAVRQRVNAEELLRSTDGQLKMLAGRTIDAQRQETVGQIRNYMDGARSALREGDVRRAGTLAQKAYLLAEDLSKH